MHILILPSWYPSNSTDIRGCFFREQALALSKSNLKVGVVYPELRSIRDISLALLKQEPITKENDNGVTTYRYRGISWLHRWQQFTANRFVRIGELLVEQYINENGMPDLIHVHSMIYAGVLAEKISKKYGIPYVITEHSTAFARNLYSDYQKKLIKDVTNSAKVKFAVSTSFKDLLEKQIESSQWSVCPNIVQQDFFLAKNYVKRNKKTFKFINVGALEPKKNQIILIYAIQSLIAKGFNVELSIVGSGSEHTSLKQTIEKLGLEQVVKLLGQKNRSEIIGLISESDAFVLSSTFETFGVVVIEAFSLGKPVVTTACGGPESLIDESNGLVALNNNLDDLTNKMASLMVSYQNYDENMIRNNSYNLYSEEAVVKKLLSTYKQVINGYS